MIIELVGLPGAGKTTLAKHLEQEKFGIVVKIRNTGELLWYNLLFLFCYPIRSMQLLLCVFRYAGKGNLYYKLMNLYLQHNAKYMKARKYAVALLDQGHLQNAISLFESEVEQRIFEQYVSRLPKPHLVVLLTTTKELRQQRLGDRWRPRPWLSDSEFNAWQAQSEKNYQALATSLQGPRFGVPVYEYGGEQVGKLQKQLSAFDPWYFVMHARMPTEKAHGVQMASTAAALVTKGVTPIFLLPYRENPIKETISRYYGLPHDISTQYLGTHDYLKLFLRLRSLGYVLSLIIYAIMLLQQPRNRNATHYTRSPFLGFLLSLRTKRVIVELHALPRLSFFLPHLLRSVQVVANSDGTKNALGAIAVSSTTVPNGVDLVAFDRRFDQSKLRKQLGLPQDPFLFLYVGSFQEWKGVPFLLKTWKSHFADHPELALVLVGGELKRGEWGSNVHSVPHVLHELVPDYVQSADALVLPNVPVHTESTQYTSPIKLFEYLASGVPIIASDLPSIKALLDDSNAYLFRAGDTGALKQTIEEVMISREISEKKVSHARELAKNYSWEKRAERLIEIRANVIQGQ